MKNFLRYWLPLLAYMGFIFFLSAQHGFPIEMPAWFFCWDKFVHAGLFGILAFLFLRNWLRGDLSMLSFKIMVITVLFVSLYGASDEFHQIFVAGRTPDVFDWLADTTGAGLMCFLLRMYKKNSPQNGIIQAFL